MAVVFRLANKSQAITYDFLTGNLRPQNMTRTPNGDGWLTTAMTLVARTTDANIISAANSIDELAEAVDLYSESKHRTESIWLEESSTGETTKRSFIQSLELTPLQVGHFSPLLGKTGALYTLVIVHSAAWENITLQQVHDNGISGTGGTITLPAIDGSLPGRINYLYMYGVDENTDATVTMWCGIRPHETTATDTDFNPVVELELGTLVAPAALGSDSDNASPIGTTDNVVTYACTTDDVKIIYETMDDAFTSTNYDHWVGEYKVLLRCKLNTAQTVRLHIDTGYLSGSVFLPGNYVYTSSTDYTLLDMGNTSIPPFPHLNSKETIQNFEFQLYAQRIGTAVTLTADCLILIPTAHYFNIQNALLDDNVISEIYMYTHEDGQTATVNVSNSYVNLAAQTTLVNWNYPIGGGILVFAGQEAAIHYIADTANVWVYYFERFRTHGE